MEMPTSWCSTRSAGGAVLIFTTRWCIRKASSTNRNGRRWCVRVSVEGVLAGDVVRRGREETSSICSCVGMSGDGVLSEKYTGRTSRFRDIRS